MGEYTLHEQLHRQSQPIQHKESERVYRQIKDPKGDITTFMGATTLVFDTIDFSQLCLLSHVLRSI